jgi:hypothetical protein
LAGSSSGNLYSTAPSSLAASAGDPLAEPKYELVENNVLISQGQFRAGLVSRLAQSWRLAVLFASSPSWTSGKEHSNSTRPVSAEVPSTPVPSPPPAGSSGAMASSFGIAFSIFFTLASLLLLGGLPAMRRLRLASEPWRAAPFVLIPERPG